MEDAVRGAAEGRRAGSSGRPVGPRNAAGVGSEPRNVPSVSGLQKPIQRQYWIGIGWSRPQACLNFSLLGVRDARVVGELRRRAARRGEEDPVDDDRDPEQDGDRLERRRSTNFVIGVRPQPEYRCLGTTGIPLEAAHGLRGRYTRGRGSRTAWPVAARAAATGRPECPDAPSIATGSDAEPEAYCRTNQSSPFQVGADLRAVGEVVADARVGELDVLAVVQRDLDRLARRRPSGTWPWRP